MKARSLNPLFLSVLLIELLCLSANAQPTVISADPLGNPNAITIVYSTAMDPASATNTAHYSLTNAAGMAVPITSATLWWNQEWVSLILGASLQLSTNYTLVIQDVTDAALNTLTPNPTLVSFYFGYPNAPTFTFDDGLVPFNTYLSQNATDAQGNNCNPDLSVTNAGGYANSGMLILTEPALGQTYGQWHLGNVLPGRAVTNLIIAYDVFLGGGSGGNATVAYGPAGGNGLVFHWGPGLNPLNGQDQYVGGGSSWGVVGQPDGLDVTLRTYSSFPNTPGINIYYGGTAGASQNVPVATNSYTGYYRGDVTNFAYSTHVVVNVQADPAQTNALLTMTVSNAWDGLTIVFTNLLLTNFAAPITDHTMAFTATDGAGAHEYAFLDNVDLNILPHPYPPPMPVAITAQPASVTTNENVLVTFSVGVAGWPPFFYQWYSNGVALAEATNSSYLTPLTLYATMNGTSYYVTVSNLFGAVTSFNAVLTIVPDTSGVQVASVGSPDGTSVGVLFTSYIDAATASNPSNYLINGAAPLAADLRTDLFNYGDPVLNYSPAFLKTVRLVPAATLTGPHVVTVTSNVLSRTGLPVSQTNLIGTVLSMAESDLGTTGTDPQAAGSALAFGPGQIEVLAGGSDMMSIGPTGTNDHGHWVYQPRASDFDVQAQLFFLTPTSAGAKAGIMVRPPPSPTNADSPALSELVFPPPPGRDVYETAYRPTNDASCQGWYALGAPYNGNALAFWPGPNWLRVKRLGPTFYGYISSDGVTWTLNGKVILDTNTFPSLEDVGLAVTAGNNDGRLCEADFANWGPVTFSNAVVTITSQPVTNVLASTNQSLTLCVGATLSGSNVPQSELVFHWQVKHPGQSDFADILDGTGNTNCYGVTSLTLSDDGVQYRAIAFAGDIAAGHSATSAVTTVRVVLPPPTPPCLFSVTADASFLRIYVTFDQPLDLACPLTFTITPPVSISSTNLVLAPDGSCTVVLDLTSPLSPGARYSLCASDSCNRPGDIINTNCQCRAFTAWTLAYGCLKYERWNGPSFPSGYGPYSCDIANLLNNPRYPDSPDTTELITYSGYPNGDISNSTNNLFDFGARISGFVIPPTNGNYNFYVRGNDGTGLWVSPDSTPPVPTSDAPKALADVCFVAPGPSWLFGVTHLLSPLPGAGWVDTNAMPLLAGQLYAVTALEQQGNGTSWLEFTWGNPLPAGERSLTNTAGGAYPVGTPPARGGAPTNSYNLKGTNIAVWVSPDLSAITANGPANTTVQQARQALLSVAASAVLSAGGTPLSVPVNYQWLRNGAILASATNSSYATPPAAYPADNRTVYSVVMSVSGAPFMTITNSATLTVTAPNPPPPGCLGIAYVDGQVILTWCTDTALQAAPAVTGPWTNVPGASSPYTNDLCPATPEMFFRLR